MNAPNRPLLSEVLLGAQPIDHPNLDLASDGVRRYIWQSAYGAMLDRSTRRNRLRQRCSGGPDG